MLSIIQKGHMDDITLRDVNNKEKLVRHDLVQRKLRKQQHDRTATTSQSPPTAWQVLQSRRSAEERKLRTPHFFQAISDSGTSIQNQQAFIATPEQTSGVLSKAQKRKLGQARTKNLHNLSTTT